MVSSHAQNAIVNFGYDANGNRISRTLTVAKVEEKGKSDDITTTLDFISEETNAFGGVTVSIYPNPTHDNVTVEAPGLVEVKVYGMMGGEVKHVAANGQQKVTFSVEELPAGLYVVRTIDRNGRQMSQKMLVVK